MLMHQHAFMSKPCTMVNMKDRRRLASRLYQQLLAAFVQAVKADLARGYNLLNPLTGEVEMDYAVWPLREDKRLTSFEVDALLSEVAGLRSLSEAGQRIVMAQLCNYLAKRHDERWYDYKEFLVNYAAQTADAVCYDEDEDVVGLWAEGCPTMWFHRVDLEVAPTHRPWPWMLINLQVYVPCLLVHPEAMAFAARLTKPAGLRALEV
ncbi:MAG: hypothetical protein D6746_09050 [Bacteroidetes bacterium]|nr:MAG: hypothetical protein D6746_09050 [Bacteroidota bacterium]